MRLVIIRMWEGGGRAMSWWWYGWGADRDDGRCAFPFVFLSCSIKTRIDNCEQGFKGNVNYEDVESKFLRGVPLHKRASLHKYSESEYLIIE